MSTPLTDDPRQIVQVSASESTEGRSLYALAADGSLWRHTPFSTLTWQRVWGLPTVEEQP